MVIVEKMWGFFWGQDSRHRGEALHPDAYVGNHTAARPLHVATGAIRLYLPGLWQEFPDVEVADPSKTDV